MEQDRQIQKFGEVSNYRIKTLSICEWLPVSNLIPYVSGVSSFGMGWLESFELPFPHGNENTSFPS